MGIVWSGTHSALLDSKKANIVVGHWDVGENDSASKTVMDARRNLPNQNSNHAPTQLPYGRSPTTLEHQRGFVKRTLPGLEHYPH